MKANPIPNPKVLIIGLDGATFDLMRPWIKQNRLPTICKLVKDGVSGTLTSTIPSVTPLAWACFMTGQNPGKVGVFHFTKRRSDTYEPRLVNSTDVKGQTIWDILSESGKKVCSLFNPMTYPPQEVNGIMVSSFLAPNLECNFTFPEKLKEELINNIDRFRIHNREAYSPGREEIYLKDLHDLIDMKEKTTLYLLKKYPWDFFMVTFMATDHIQHKFWKFIDSKNSFYDHEQSIRYRNEIFRVYLKMDNIIKKILDNTEGDIVVIIVSDHGAGPLYKWVYFNRWLMDLGLLKLKRDPRTKMKYYISKFDLPMKFYKILSKLGLARLRWIVPRTTRETIMSSFLSFLDIDWSRTKAYSYGQFGGQIYINLRGREPQGIVEPGGEYEELRDYIIQKLYEFRDPETNEKIVDKVYKKEEIYSGHVFDRSPDIVFLMEKIGYDSSTSFGLNADSVVWESEHLDPGTHRTNGIFIIKGPHIERGTKIEGARLIDIAPTVLYIMGMPIPKNMDGRVLTEVFNESFLRENPTRYQQVEDEKEKLKRRIKNLKYLGKI